MDGLCGIDEEIRICEAVPLAVLDGFFGQLTVIVRPLCM